MNLTNYYWYFQSAIPERICDDIVKYGHQLQHQMAVTGGYGDGKKLNQKQIKDLKTKRDSNIVWMSDRWIYKEIQPYVHRANQSAGWNYEWDFSESCQFTKYQPGQFYGWHADGNSCHFGKYKRWIPGVSPVDKTTGKAPRGYTENPNMVGKVRKLSITINLNKPGEYDGGNLKFDFGPHADIKRYHECEEIRPQGSVIIFPSFVYHCVTPVTRGTRYSLVLWTLGDPFK